MVGSLTEISDFDCTGVEGKTTVLFHVNTDTMAETEGREGCQESSVNESRCYTSSADSTGHMSKKKGINELDVLIL